MRFGVFVVHFFELVLEVFQSLLSLDVFLLSLKQAFNKMVLHIGQILPFNHKRARKAKSVEEHEARLIVRIWLFFFYQRAILTGDLPAVIIVRNLFLDSYMLLLHLTASLFLLAPVL